MVTPASPAAFKVLSYGKLCSFLLVTENADRGLQNQMFQSIDFPGAQCGYGDNFI